MSNAQFTVRLTRAADRDIDEILDYALETRSSVEAAQLIGDLLDKTLSLAEFPDRGSKPMELASVGEHRYRQLKYHQYRIIYRRIDRVVFIYLIADGRRDMLTLLDQRLTAD